MDRRTALQNCAMLMGYGMATSVAGFSLVGCGSDDDLWQPQFFTQEEAHFLRVFSDVLLPTTETPGAIDVNVHKTIDSMVHTCFDSEGQIAVRAGLRALEITCQEDYGDRFVECTNEGQTSFMRTLESTEVNENKYLWGNTIVSAGDVPFYRQLKGLTLFAFFTSEEIGERVLNYDPIPGAYVGCRPVSEIGKVWSL